VDLGDWSIRNWRALAGLTSAVLVVSRGLAGAITDYRSYFPALGGPNGLLYDLTLKVAQPCAPTSPPCPRCSSPLMTRHFQLQILRLVRGRCFSGVGSPDRWAAGGQGASDRFRRGVCRWGPISESAPLFCRTTTGALSTVATERGIASSSGDFPAFRRRLLSRGQPGGHASEFSTFSLNQMEGCEAPRDCSASLMAVSHWDSSPWRPA
jgi:hypothetical protein